MFSVNTSLLEVFVLAVLAKDDAYGYALTQEIRELVDVSETALYPVLRRLFKEGLLEDYSEVYMGRLRRYYTLSEAGKQQFKKYKKEWKEYRIKIDKVLFDEEDTL